MADQPDVVHDHGPRAEIFGTDAYAPPQISARVEQVGVAKANLGTLPLFVLGILAGGFIGLGALSFTIVLADTTLSFAASRLVGGVAFSLGLILVVVAGAELFTGNNLLVMAWVGRSISTTQLLRNWTLAYLGNALGAGGLVLMVVLANHGSLGDGAVGAAAVRIAQAKVALPFWEAFFKGVLCNMLVCLAVWLSVAGRSVIDKVVAVVFPISAFVAAGFEHSIANLYFLPLGYLWQDQYAAEGTARIEPSAILANLLPVTLGNIVGGALLVAGIYYLVYHDPTVAAHGQRPPDRAQALLQRLRRR